MSSGNLIQDTHPVTLLAPAADSLAATVTTNSVNMQDNTHATIYLSRGAVASGTSTITIQSSADSAATSPTAIPFYYRTGTVSTLDAYGDQTAATSAGYTTTAEKDNIIDVIEVNASDLDGTDKYFSLKSVEVVNHPQLVGIVAVMSGQRQQGDGTRTVRV